MLKKNIDIDIGRRLRTRRTMLGFSQQTVAKAVGITFQQVQKYEKGANAMNSNRLYEFAKFMNVPVAYFFEETGAQPSIERESIMPTKTAGQVSDRESLEMMKAFRSIKQPIIRKRLADLVRAIADYNAS